MRLSEIFFVIGEEYDIDIERLHVGKDHVHIHCSFPPRLSISQAVTRLKSISTRLLFKEYPYLRERFFSGKLWEEGYFARTVGDGATRDAVNRYIEAHKNDVLVEPFFGQEAEE